LRDFNNKFSAFQKEYDKQVHPSRKQLEDKAKTFSQLELESSRLLDEVYYFHRKNKKILADYDAKQWVSLEELLSGSEETHYVTVPETREKLKEGQK